MGVARGVVIGAVLVLSLAGSSVLAAEPPAGPGERKTCDAYAMQAQSFARGREAGVTLEQQLGAAAAACERTPTSRSACKDFPARARAVYEGNWTVDEAGKNVRADCGRYVSADPATSPPTGASPRPSPSAARR
jgi:hypothetical protein